MGLGVECLDFDIRFAFLDIAGGTRLNRLAGFDDAGLIDGLVVLNDAESLGKLVVLDVLHVDAQLAAFLQLGDRRDRDRHHVVADDGVELVLDFLARFALGRRDRGARFGYGLCLLGVQAYGDEGADDSQADSDEFLAMSRTREPGQLLRAHAASLVV